MLLHFHLTSVSKSGLFARERNPWIAAVKPKRRNTDYEHDAYTGTRICCRHNAGAIDGLQKKRIH